MNGVIQGSFPNGIPRHVGVLAQPIQASRGRTYDELARDAHRRVAGVAQPSMHGAFMLPPHLATFGRRVGQRLAPALQQKMESFFKAGFSDVQVHVGPEAASIGALAFTQGSHIYFAPGQYRPDTVVGQQLLGHELTHVVQQRAGRVRHPFGHGVAVVQDPGLESEAERMGLEAARHQPVLQPYATSVLLHADPALHVSGPVKVSRDSYRITAGPSGQPAGSVMLHSRGSAVELTDLGVQAPHRGRGLGQALIASALRAGARLGKSTVRLASDDTGSGALTRWYRSLGFKQVGVDSRGLPRLEAPIQRLAAGVAQGRMLVPLLPAAGQLLQPAAASSSKELSFATKNKIEGLFRGLSYPIGNKEIEKLAPDDEKEDSDESDDEGGGGAKPAKVKKKYDVGAKAYDSKGEVVGDGKYTSGPMYHAEMVAFDQALAAGKSVAKIRVSKPSCRRCAVVFHLLGMTDKVGPRGSSATAGGSYKIPDNVRAALASRLPSLKNYSDYSIDQIASVIEGGSWW